MIMEYNVEGAKEVERGGRQKGELLLTKERRKEERILKGFISLCPSKINLLLIRTLAVCTTGNMRNSVSKVPGYRFVPSQLYVSFVNFNIVLEPCISKKWRFLVPLPYSVTQINS